MAGDCPTLADSDFLVRLVPFGWLLELPPGLSAMVKLDNRGYAYPPKTTENVLDIFIFESTRFKEFFSFFTFLKQGDHF